MISDDGDDRQIGLPNSGSAREGYGQANSILEPVSFCWKAIWSRRNFHLRTRRAIRVTMKGVLVAIVEMIIWSTVMSRNSS